jgi:uncharacterized protein YndB with AHSA1/START domain
MNDKPLIFERELDAPAAKVWDALTNNAQMKKWYFQLADFQPVAGFEFNFKGGPDEQNQYTHLCKVTEAIPGKKIAYSWRYEGYPGISVVSFELFAEGNKTKLVLKHADLETFDQSNPDFAKSNFVMGWNAILDNSLKPFVERK